MGPTLTAADLVRLETASRALMSPLAAASPEAWLAEAGGAVRDLVGGTGVVLQFPTSAVPYFSDDATEVSTGVLDYTQEIQWDGVRFSDPVVDAWNRMRRESRMETFSWDVNIAMVRDRGLDPNDAPIITDVLQGQRFNDFVGMIGETPVGEAMVWVLHRRYGGFPFGERSASLLQVLMPSFRAGLDALGRLGAHRAALDAVSEPLAAFDADGRALHRNAALAALLAADPEGATVDREVARLGRASRALARAVRGAVPPSEVTVTTARGQYVVRSTALPPGLFGPDPAVLVTVDASIVRVPPTAEEVRQRTGLTLREAEVALLLAEGLTNAQVADRLFIAPATARRHTENVLGKLGVATRSAVAGRVFEMA
ncbi:helix-turn-helix transcriptional regulator [Rubrivirga marina]|uniref:HTH luxR-type domain-containing protein n=1 Tax=Rubrivirga marina TaxID=1196024 RepID=A0A271IYE8_9BACT|nr:LuxR C-terminal-related transcriptional regulator [Rubrivirga marina]PAP75988.1 hypothetical protein BSZ37_05795 [Rubrivirga marina]